MGFARVKDLVDARETTGQYSQASFRKVPAIASVAGQWVDLSMAPGNPKPNYYVGAELAATKFDGIPTVQRDPDVGIYAGSAVTPATKHLHKVLMHSPTAAFAPAPFLLCDYLLFYPLVDMDSTDTQPLVNGTPLPRYTDGAGVKMMLVATNPYVGGASVTVTYTNSAGVSGRTTRAILTNTGTYIGTLVTTGPAAGLTSQPFLELAQGDTGVRSVQSVTFSAPNGGLAALVLVKPIATMMLRETTAWAEFDFLVDKPSMPVIQDGAYLGWLCCGGASVAGAVLIGELHTYWG